MFKYTSVTLRLLTDNKNYDDFGNPTGEWQEEQIDCIFTSTANMITFGNKVINEIEDCQYVCQINHYFTEAPDANSIEIIKGNIRCKPVKIAFQDSILGIGTVTILYLKKVEDAQ